MLTRRGFIRVGALTLAAGLVATLRSMAGRFVAVRPSTRFVTVPASPADDATFAEDVIVCRTGGTVRAFSARCTHLGCLITQQADGLLACPCHGSQFRTDGSVARGPAGRPLQILPHRVDSKTGSIVVQVS